MMLMMMMMMMMIIIIIIIIVKYADLPASYLSELVLALTQIISRVHLVHLMNVEQHQAAVDPQTKPTDLGCEYNSSE